MKEQADGERWKRGGWAWSPDREELNPAFDFIKISCKRRSHSETGFQNDTPGISPAEIN